MWSFENCEQAIAQSGGGIDIHPAAEAHENTIFTASDLDFQRSEARAVIAEQCDWFLSLAKPRIWTDNSHSVLKLVFAKGWPLSGREQIPEESCTCPTKACNSETVDTMWAAARPDTGT